MLFRVACLALLGIAALALASKDVLAEDTSERLSAIVVAGSRPISAADLNANEGQQKVLVGGLLLVTMRNGKDPEAATIWAEAGSGIVFFDVAPLVGLVSYPSGANALETAAKSPGVDLRAIMGTAAPTGTDNAFRDAFLEATHGPITLAELRRTHERQRAFLNVAHDDDLWLLSLLELQGSKRDTSKSWQVGFQDLFRRATRTAPPQLWKRVWLFPGAEPRVLAYATELPVSGPGKLSGSLLVGLEGREPLRVPLSFEMPGKGTSTWDAIVAFVAKVLENAVGVLVAAAVGYGAFRVQRRHERDTDIEALFETRKVEKSQAIRSFFTERYAAFADANEVQDRARLIRDALVNEGIFSILPAKDAIHVNKLASSKSFGEGPLAELEGLLRRRFGEFMTNGDSA